MSTEANKNWDFPGGRVPGLNLGPNKRGPRLVKTTDEIPQRFFGPVSPDEAERLTEQLWDDPKFKQDFIDWACNKDGTFDQRELMFRIQASYVAEQERPIESEPLYDTAYDDEGEEHA